MSSTIENQITQEELDLLTPFNFAVCMYMLDQAKRRGEISPTWLAISVEHREKCKQEFLTLVNQSEDDIHFSIIMNFSLQNKFNTWKQAETDYRNNRHENPRMFFAEYIG